MNNHEPDVVIAFENLLQACNRLMMPRECFADAILIYKELIEVRTKLREVEMSLPVGK